MSEYNTPIEQLRASLESIMVQTYADFELVLIDDCGRNDVDAVVAELDDARIVVHHNAANMGLAASLSYGITAIARGQLIARMDTDDVYAPEHLQRLVSFARAHPEFAVYSSQSQEFSAERQGITLGREGEITASDLMRGRGPIHPATLIRRSDFGEVGGYPEYKRAEDFALWSEMFIANKRMYMTADLTHRYRVENTDFQKRKLRNRGDEIRARLYYYPRMGARPVHYLKIVKSIVSGALPIGLTRRLRKYIHR
ncbi:MULTISPECIES: glycosyltransferase [unclassified Microbacterium]|uniref:glycosyltransferase family 2 protein n=1 Tax=unclassified Microbacterium TaxID=2609290 RepID=UPI0012FA7EBF|nr:glycosyltransferase [Microbacterium sp. MAH-37]